MDRALTRSDPSAEVQGQALNQERQTGFISPRDLASPPLSSQEPSPASPGAQILKAQGPAGSCSSTVRVLWHSAMTRSRMDPKLHSRQGTCFAFPRCSAGTRGASEPAQAAPCQQPHPSRDGPGSTPGAGCCAWTRLRRSCSLHVAWHATSLVRSQPILQWGTAVSRGLEQPSSQQAAAGLAPGSRTLRHCGPAGFSRDASKGCNQISREGSRHVPGYAEELSRQCQELGQLLGTAAGQRKIKQAAPKPGLCLTAQLQELPSLCRALFANPAAELPCPGTSSSFVLHQQILNNQPGGLGWGKDPAGGAGKYFVGRQLSEENRKVASGKGSSLHTGRLFLIRACLDWSHPHCTSTSTPRSQPRASCCSQQDRGAAVTKQGQELTLALPIPPLKGLGGPSGFQGAASWHPSFLPSSEKALSPPAPQPGAVTCPQHSPWAAGGHSPAVPRLSAPSLPSLCSGCQSSQESCRHKASLFPGASPCFPSSLAEQLCCAGECRRLLDQGKGSARMDMAGMGFGVPCWPHLFYSSKGCPAKAQPL